ncbi:hypothetical protein BY996DRAFT_4574438 [Phakopsora pachyrhizi]|uniref:Trm112p-domain-containing protein n=1 Tax=Phakopsora pachyrhizi TaxID=170000 RepID=A0A0S1MIA6_PHAPC|nr:hypothetical protein BY996DRAFT_4574438 [Phakopsora pachyrhizi]CAH7682587.1 hypothetical protein PPACK8108_LOCUS15563 [Phakopsora pachyrhizi]CAH7683292.1 hypothetical protein PPACK8108_LOCUS16730 [Phakopsora pachyrhizi]
MVRLITHNLLSCNAKTCSSPSNFPLRFNNVSLIESRPIDFNPKFIIRFLIKLDYQCLLESSRSLGDESLPDRLDIERPDSISEETLRSLHHALFEIHVVEGEMVCPSCNHIFQIKDGIPNMLLAEHEIR